MRKQLPSLLMTLCLGLFSFFSNAQIGTLDTTFNQLDIGFKAEANEMIHALALQSDGKVVIGGTFTAYNDTARKGIARLNSDGYLDVSFNPGSGANNSVYALAVQGDGKIIIGGGFTAYNGATRSYLARLNADGSLDAGFAPNFNDAVYAVAVQKDGKVLIGGAFTSVNDVPCNYITRLNADGSLDATFTLGTGANNAVYTIALQTDGKILIGGAFSFYNAVSRNGVARLNADGVLDTSFNPGSGASGGTVYTLAIQNDGKVLIGGYFTAFNGVARNYIARLNTNGVLDTTFNPGSGASGGGVLSIAVQTDGKIVIGGYFTAYNGTNRSGVARLNANGTVDASFYPGNGFNGGVLSTAIQSDEKFIVGGSFTSYNSVIKNRIARINVKGPTLIIDAISSSAVCAGGNLTVSFTVLGVFTIGNKFTAQLSDAAGRFTAPVNIGTATGTTSGSINVTIPIATAGGSNYRIRLVSDNPAVASFDNGSDLTVTPASATPTITAGSATTFCAGSSVMLTSSATAGNQWFRNGGLVASGQSYVATSTGSYTVRTNENGCYSAPSTAVAVTATTLPAATITYSGSPFCPAGTATPTLTGTKGGTYSTTSDISVNATTGVVNLSVPAGTYAVNYTIAASGGCNAVTSTTSIIIRQPAAITTQPVAGAVCTGNSISFNVVASGTGLTYQWMKNGLDISGATAATYTISSADLADAGSYSVKVSNACASEVSKSVPLTVTQSITISTQPTAQTLCTGGTATFSVVATGSKLTYQWRKNNVNISGATGNTYTISNVAAADAGSYNVVVSGDCVSKTSHSVALTVNIPATITTQPAAQTVCSGTSASFTVNATGTALSYQWRKAGNTIAGATSSTYTIASVTAADAGSYDVIVTSACNAVTSATAALNVNPAPATPIITTSNNVLTSSATAGNQWFLNGTALTGATVQSIAAPISGVFTVRVTQGSCSTTSAPFNFVITRIDGPGAWNGEVSLYPNPVVKTLVIRNPAGRKLQVQLFDGNGKKVYESTLRTTQGTIDMQGFANGIYQVMITDTAKNESVLQTIVKL
jgi:trimeric autotransporter adhesin